MKTKLLILPLLIVIALTTISCHHEARLDNYNDSISWVLGNQMGREFVALQDINGLAFNKEKVVEAFVNALDRNPSVIDDSTAQQIYLNFTTLVQRNNRTTSQQMEQATSDKEQDFFTQLVNERPQVQKHPSGIYYEVMQAGKGPKAKIGDIVKFDYRAYNMISGEEVDRTYGNREPIVHVLGEPMFRGLIEGMQLMNAGSIYRLYVPNQMAFGAQGTATIPAYTPVIYDVELHSINQ